MMSIRSGSRAGHGVPRRHPAWALPWELGVLVSFICNRFRKFVGAGSLSLGALCLLPFQVFSGASVALAWDPSPDSVVIGYRLYVGTESGIYSETIESGPATQAVASELHWDTLYFFAVTAYDAKMLESDYSAPISYRTPKEPVLPVIHEDPSCQIVLKGNSASLSVTGTGQSPLAYQWYKEGVPLSNDLHFDGVNTLTLNILNADDSCAGVYSIVLSNAAGSVRSLAAAVQVVSKPRVQAVTTLNDGNQRVIIAAEDHGPLNPAEVFRLTVVASTNPEPRSTWLTVPSVRALQDGMVIVDETNALNFPQRYYRTLQPGTLSSPVQMNRPKRLPDGTMRLGLLSAGGLPLNSADILNFEIKVNTNRTGSAQWTLLTHNMIYTNGILTVDDTNAVWSQNKAYQIFIK